MLFHYGLNYQEALENPSKLSSVTASIRPNVLKAMVARAKYLGFYEEYKAKLKSYGIKWSTEDTNFNAFLAVFNHNHENLPLWIKEVQPILRTMKSCF